MCGRHEVAGGKWFPSSPFSLLLCQEVISIYELATPCWCCHSTVNDNPNRRCILKLTSLMGRWNHRAVSRTLPCQQAAGCCHVVTAFCLSGSAGKTRKCWCILLWIQQAGFSFLTTIPGRSLLPLLFHFSLSVFASMEWLPFLLPTCFHPSNLRMLFSTWPLSWVLSLLENILSSDCCTKTHGLNGSENNYFS